MLQCFFIKFFLLNVKCNNLYAWALNSSCVVLDNQRTNESPKISPYFSVQFTLEALKKVKQSFYEG